MQKQSLTPTDIIDYLTQHKDFFLHHPEILDELNLHHTQNNTLSLVEMQLDRQRHRIQELEAELEKFTQLAIQNSDIFLGLLPLQQQLSQAHNLTEGIQKLDQWVKKFELQQAKILLFTDAWQKGKNLTDEVWLDRKAFEIVRLERFGLRRFYLGQMTHKEKTMLFLPEEFPIGSVACCLLGGKNSQKPTALLLFSARDERHFHNGQDTEFLKHLVDIVTLHLGRWVDSFKKA
ncbi:DUF484 family protein [Pasteurella multocida]|uniref:DUF484 family protein n=1 Tax=Pasteurella multocida TaxID=747 RepID=UPI0023017D94|nr:DUF484 family protein [Pasteurella multocida]MDA5608377.1 DUF484 family protein [Pasteurella multocida subsp. multocida]MDA5615938.1 DUF484 family protein [Pasteurella multocida]MDA5625948.1 DUF484 family protein [Pasteurella multocida]